MSESSDVRPSWDLIVLGGDLEGRAAAAEAANGGLRTLLVDEFDEHAGPWDTTDLAPGFHANGLVDDTQTVPRGLLANLDLASVGLSWHDAPTPRYGVAPNGTLARVDDDHELSRAFGPEAARRFGQWRRFVHQLKGPLESLFLEHAPDPSQLASKDLFGLASKLLGIRRLGKDTMFELLRVVPQPAWDLADERLDTGGFGAAWIAPAILGLPHGPRAPGTGALVLLESMLEGARVEGGPPVLAAALLASARRAGAGVRFGLGIRRVLLDEGRVRGVLLSDGSECLAPAVLSTRPLRRSLRNDFRPGELPPALESIAETWRTRGTVALLRLALEHSPLPNLDRTVRVVSAPDLQTIEASAEAHWLDRMPERPSLVIDVDPTAAPEGGALLNVQVHGVGSPTGGFNDAKRAQLERVVRSELARLFPRFRDPVASELLTPADLERRFQIDGGHLAGGETSLDRLWVRRPHLALSRYATPLEGFYLGGQAIHPGANFRTASGILAARRVLEDTGRA